jgi:hypothetical protein
VTKTFIKPGWKLQEIRYFRRWKGFPAYAFLILLCIVPARVRAEHFDFTLTVKSAAEKVEAHSDDDPPAGGFNPRPILHGRAGETMHWLFLMTNTKPHDPFLQLKVRYYLALETKAGQKEPTAPIKDSTVEGEFVVDLKYKGRVGVQQHFRLDKPGVYLLRVETDNSHSDHEHFSAIDIEIK